MKYSIGLLIRVCQPESQYFNQIDKIIGFIYPDSYEIEYTRLKDSTKGIVVLNQWHIDNEYTVIYHHNLKNDIEDLIK